MKFTFRMMVIFALAAGLVAVGFYAHVLPTLRPPGWAGPAAERDVTRLNMYKMQVVEREYLEVWADGSALYVRYVPPIRKVSEVRIGKVSRDVTGKIFNGLQRALLGLRSSYRGSGELLFYQELIVEVYTRRGQQSKDIFAEIDAAPATLRELVDIARRTPATLSLLSRPQIVLVAEIVAPERARAIEAAGTFKFNRLSAAELSRSQPVAEVISEPGRFVHIDANLNEATERILSSSRGGMLFLSTEEGTYYQVTIYRS